MSVLLVCFVGEAIPPLPAALVPQPTWGTAHLTFAIRPNGGWALPLESEAFALERVETPDGLPPLSAQFREELRIALHRRQELIAERWLRDFDAADAPEGWTGRRIPAYVLWR